MTDSDPDVRWMSYAEAAKALGVNPESVARRMRRDNWARRRGNDGRPRVAVPVSHLPVLAGVLVNVPDGQSSVLAGVPVSDPDGLRNAASSTASVPDIIPAENPDKAALLALTERAARAEGEAVALREALGREQEALARERQRADGAEVRESELRASMGHEADRADRAEAARREAAEELAGWAAGNPVARAWRALIYRRGR